MIMNSLSAFRSSQLTLYFIYNFAVSPNPFSPPNSSHIPSKKLPGPKNCIAHSVRFISSSTPTTGKRTRMS